MNWLKLYAEFAIDPKVQSMSERMQRRLVMLFCLECSGDLPKLNDRELALALRIKPDELEKTRELFIAKGFINGSWSPKNWGKRQAPSDRTAAERMRRLRARDAQPDRNVARNIGATDRNVTRTLRVEAEAEKKPPRGGVSSIPPKSPPAGGTGWRGAGSASGADPPKKEPAAGRQNGTHAVPPVPPAPPQPASSSVEDRAKIRAWRIAQGFEKPDKPAEVKP